MLLDSQMQMQIMQNMGPKFRLQDALRHLLPCFSSRRQFNQSTKIQSFNLDDNSSNSGSRRNTEAANEDTEVETRDKGSPSLVNK